MILYAYGDSWTEGQGCFLEEEQKIKDRVSLKEFRNLNSWPAMLSEKLNCKYENSGCSGNANNLIFNNVITDLKNEKIKKGDFVIVMWSSSLRDVVPFLPKGEWVSWSVKELAAFPHKFFESHKDNNEKYDIFLEKYKKFFLSELFNQNYYNIVNQNYIIFLQQMFEEYGVRYVFCDAFDMMIQNLSKTNNLIHLINTNNYWGFMDCTIRDYLLKVSDESAWEYPKPISVVPSNHPNKKGYQLIADELFNFIKTNKVI